MDLYQTFGRALEIATGIAFFLAGLAIVGIGIGMAAQDAIRRGKSPWLVSIACVLFFPWGLVAWLIFRPDPVDSGKDQFELENFRLQ